MGSASFTPKLTRSANLDLALGLADAGIPVHPFRLDLSTDKLIPASKHGRDDATCKLALIEQWNAAGLLFSIPTGMESGSAALDLDVPHGPAWFTAQLAERGIDSAVDVTPIWSASRSDGFHGIFAFRDGCPALSRASDIAADVDTRAAGEDVARGMRGSSALFAAADLVMSIDDCRAVELEKVKDGETGQLCSFRLQPVQLGFDDDGDRITSCTVEIAATDAGPRKPKGKITPQAKRALDMIIRLYNSGKAQVVPASEINLEGVEGDKVPLAVAIDECRQKCRAAKLTTEGSDKSEATAFRRSLECLESAGKIGRYGDFLWLLKDAKQAGDIGRHRATNVATPSRGSEGDIGRHDSIGVSPHVALSNDNDDLDGRDTL